MRTSTIIYLIKEHCLKKAVFGSTMQEKYSVLPPNCN